VQRLAAGPGESRITADAVAMSMMGAYARRVVRAASMGANEMLELYSRCRVNQVRSVLHLHKVRGGVPRGEGTGAGPTGRVCVHKYCLWFCVVLWAVWMTGTPVHLFYADARVVGVFVLRCPYFNSITCSFICTRCVCA
jgi:hypothetical protein